MRKKIIFVLACMCALILSIGVSFAADEVRVEVSDEAGLKKAIDEATKTTPVTIVLKQNITLSDMITIDGNVDITLESAQGSNFSIYAPEGIRHFYLENAALTVQNAILDGNHKGGGIDIDGTDRNFEALLTLKEGAAIKNCYRNKPSYYGGGAVSLTANSTSTPWKARLVIDGGEISNNKFESTSSLATAGGGGIYANGIGVTVELKDGAIKGNSSQNGGAVKLAEDAKFIMSGGEISNNSNWLNYGSGVLLMYGSSFIMNGGTIENNKQINGSGNYYGGGVCVFEDDSSFTMNGGTIKNNGEFVQSAAPSSGCRGGGVCVYGTAKFIMEKGTVKNNMATSGAGVMLTASYLSDTPILIMKNDSSIEHNYAQYSGAGVGSLTPQKATIEMHNQASIRHNVVNPDNVTSTGNAGFAGGGIHLSSFDAHIKMYDSSSVCNNTVNSVASTGIGGGISCGANVELNDKSSIHDNKVLSVDKGTDVWMYANGGGLYIGGEYTATITDDASIYNNTVFGGGGGIYASNKADIKMDKNAAVTGNTAGYAGGGVYINDDAATENEQAIFTMNGGKISENTSLGRDGVNLGEGGGGIYIKTTGTDKALVRFETTGNAQIINNKAPNGNGGGIYCKAISAEDPWSMELDIAEDTVFSGNSALKAYIPPQDVFTKYPKIKFAGISIADLVPYHPLNNYDINYIGDEEYVEPAPENPDDFDDPEKPGKDAAADSGDEFSLAAMIAVMMLAAAVMTAVVTVRRRG